MARNPVDVLDQFIFVIANHIFNVVCNLQIAGLETNVEFIKDLCRHPKFQAGAVHTGFIDENYSSLFPKLQPSPEILSQAALALILSEEIATLKSAMQQEDSFSPFNTEVGHRVNHPLSRRFELIDQADKLTVDVVYVEPEVYSMRVNDIGLWKSVTGTLTKQGNTLVLRSEIDGKKQKSRIVRVGRELYIFAVSKYF